MIQYTALVEFVKRKKKRKKKTLIVERLQKA